jgi:hypothetical protein
MTEKCHASYSTGPRHAEGLIKVIHVDYHSDHWLLFGSLAAILECVENNNLRNASSAVTNLFSITEAQERRPNHVLLYEIAISCWHDCKDPRKWYGASPKLVKIASPGI